MGRWFDRLLRRPRSKPGAWSKKRERLQSGAARAGVAHLVERTLPKVEVAGSRPVARSIALPSLTSNRGRPGPVDSSGRRRRPGALQIALMGLHGLWSKERFRGAGYLHSGGFV